MLVEPNDFIIIIFLKWDILNDCFGLEKCHIFYPSGTEGKLEPKATEKISDSKRTKEKTDDETASLLYSAWSSLLNGPPSEVDDNLRKLGLSKSDVPNAPHLDNCKLRQRANERLDKRNGTANFPPWTSWQGELENFRAATANEPFSYFKHQAASQGAHPPWVCSNWALNPTTYFYRCVFST